MRIMFDSNAFDKMHNSDTNLEKIIASEKYEYYITSIQVEEIGNIPDDKKEKRIQNLLALCKIRAHLLPTHAILGHARLGYCVLVGEDDVYLALLNKTGSNVHDAMIGSAAKREGCTVITDDKDFKNKLNDLSIPTMTYDEFIRSL